MDDESPVPQEVEDLVRMARTSVTEVVGVEPDLTPETLPLVDEYLRRATTGCSAEVRDLVVTAVGVYFGEVVRRKLHGRWTLKGPLPEGWRVELLNCFLYLVPVGMAGEVMVGRQTDEYDGSFATLDDLNEGLAELLSEATPISEEEYFSLAGRIDILQLAADWLVGRQLAAGKPQRTYSAGDYSVHLDADGEI